MTPPLSLSPEVEKAIDEARQKLTAFTSPRSRARVLEQLAQRVSEIERRDERRKALLEACALVCTACDERVPLRKLNNGQWGHAEGWVGPCAPVRAALEASETVSAQCGWLGRDSDCSPSCTGHRCEAEAPCKDHGPRALLVVEGEPEPKKEGA